MVTEFSGFVRSLPSLQKDEKLVLSQVLVPPLTAEYNTLKEEWLRKEVWRRDDFIEVMKDGIDPELKGKVINAVHAYLEKLMPVYITLMKEQGHPQWKQQIVESFETSLRDPPVSSNIETYMVPNTDPVQAIESQLGLRTTVDSDVFVVGIYRSRTMLELPNYTEQERLTPPKDFLKSPYWWGLEMDRYAVDAPMFCPDWMAEGPVCTKATKKRKVAAGGKAAIWSEGCTVVHSAFGYGNETVLCNDPHSQPFTDLDNCEAVEKARSASNTCVMMCRIGPWMFPVEVTTCFLPAGSPLLYFYGREYWVTNRASSALAGLADEREGKLKREIATLQQSLQTKHQECAEAVRLLSQIVGFSKAPDKSTDEQDLEAAITHDSAKSDVGTSQPQHGRSCKGSHARDSNAAAVGQLANAGSINRAGHPDSCTRHALGHLSDAPAQPGAALGQAGSAPAAARPAQGQSENAPGQCESAPGQSGGALEAVHAEVGELRQALSVIMQHFKRLESSMQQLNSGQEAKQTTLVQEAANAQHAQHAQQQLPMSDPSRRGTSGLNSNLNLSLEHAVDAPEPASMQAALEDPENADASAQASLQGLQRASKKRKHSSTSHVQTAQAESDSIQQDRAGDAPKKKKRRKKSKRHISEDLARPSGSQEQQLAEELAKWKKARKKSRKKEKAAQLDKRSSGCNEQPEATVESIGDKQQESSSKGQSGAKQIAVEVLALAQLAAAASVSVAAAETAAAEKGEKAAKAGVQDPQEAQLAKIKASAEALARVLAVQDSAEAVGAAAPEKAETAATHDAQERELAIAGRAKELGASDKLQEADNQSGRRQKRQRNRVLTPADACQTDETTACESHGCEAEAAGQQPCHPAALTKADSTDAAVNDVRHSSAEHHKLMDTAGMLAGSNSNDRQQRTDGSADVSLAKDLQSLKGWSKSLVPAAGQKLLTSYFKGGSPVPPARAVATAAMAATAIHPHATAMTPCTAAGPLAASPDADACANAGIGADAVHGNHMHHTSSSGSPNRVPAADQEAVATAVGSNASAGVLPGSAPTLAGNACDEADETEQPGSTAGPWVNVPNTPLGRLECVQSSMFSLNPGTPERRFVERHIVALNAESQRYLIATEVLQACNLSVRNATKTIRSWRSRASKQQANFAPQLAYCMGARVCQYVFSAPDIDALLTPGLLKTKQRSSLQHFMAGVWTADNSPANAEGSHAAMSGGPCRAPSSSPGPEAAANRADSSSPGPDTPTSRAVSSSPELQAVLLRSKRKRYKPRQRLPRAASNSPDPRAAGSSPDPGATSSGCDPGAASSSPDPEAAPLHASHNGSGQPACSLPASMNKHEEHTASDNAHNMTRRMTPVGTIAQAADLADSGGPTATAAAAGADPAESGRSNAHAAVDDAVPFGSPVDTSLHDRVHQQAGSSVGRCIADSTAPATDAAAVPMPTAVASLDAAAADARAQSLVGNSGTPQQGQESEAKPHAPQTPQTGPVNLSGSLSNSASRGLSFDGNVTIGKRKRARKLSSTPSQPAASSQHSNVAVPGGSDSAFDVKPDLGAVGNRHVAVPQGDNSTSGAKPEAPVFQDSSATSIPSTAEVHPDAVELSHRTSVDRVEPFLTDNEVIDLTGD